MTCSPHVVFPILGIVHLLARLAGAFAGCLRRAWGRETFTRIEQKKNTHLHGVFSISDHGVVDGVQLGTRRRGNPCSTPREKKHT